MPYLSELDAGPSLAEVLGLSLREELPPLRITPEFIAAQALELPETQRATQAVLRVVALLEEQETWFWEGVNTLCQLRAKGLEDAALDKAWEGSSMGAALRGAAKECRDFPKFLKDQAKEFRRRSSIFFRVIPPKHKEA